MGASFSLVIPTYNRAGVLYETLLSLTKQEYNLFEVFIIDDGSTDDTKALVTKFINSYPQIKIEYVYQRNQERGAARNKGILLAKNDYICFLDSDDLLLPNHFKVANRIITQNKGLEVFFFSFQIIDQNGKVLETRPSIDDAESQHLIKGNFISCNGIFIRNDIIKNNLFSEDRKIALFEDWELWLRLATKFKFHFFNEVTSYIVNHSDRSVLEIDNKKLVSKMETFMKLVLTNSDIVCYFQKDLKKFKVSCYSYISLHLSITHKYKIETLKYLLKTLILSPAFILQKRCHAIIWHFLKF